MQEIEVNFMEVSARPSRRAARSPARQPLITPRPIAQGMYSSEESELLMLEEQGQIRVMYVRRPGSGRRKSKPFKAPWHHSESGKVPAVALCAAPAPGLRAHARDPAGPRSCQH